MEPITWHTEQRKVSELIPYEHNPRRLTTFQAEKLQESLRRFGLVEIPAIDLDNKIVAGHQRLRAMILLGRGDETIDVRVPSRKLTEEEFKEYLVRSNKNVGDWDFEILGNMFAPEALQEWGFTPGELGIVPHDGKDDIDTDNMAAGLEHYMNSEIRQITLFFKAEQHADITRRLDSIMGELGVENWSEALVKLIEEHETGERA